MRTSSTWRAPASARLIASVALTALATSVALAQSQPCASPADAALLHPAGGDAASAPGILLQRRIDRLLATPDPDRASLKRRSPGLLTPGTAMPATIAKDESGLPREVELSVSLGDIAALAAHGKVASSPFDIWIEGRHANFDLSRSSLEPEARLSALYVGTHFKLKPGIMVGALAQLDRSEEAPSALDEHAEAAGWMSGPFASIELAPGVVLDGRAAWGSADTTIAAGADSAHFASDRSLVRWRLTGRRDLGAWRFTPSVGMTYLEETRHMPAGFAMLAATPQEASAGRIEMLPSLSYTTRTEAGWSVEPRATLGAIGTFDDLGALGQTLVPGTPESLRMKAEAGVAVGLENGAKLDATGGVEEGAAGAADAWSGKFKFSVPLQ